MKKILMGLVLVLGLFLVTGCDNIFAPAKGEYKEGTYMGAVEYESYGSKYVVTAVLYVDDNGLIKSCHIDSTYTKDGVNTTKKTLGDAYGMKSASAAQGNIDGGAEWYEQVAVIEDKVIEEQGIDWVTWEDDEKTKLDAVSGVTITADHYIEAISKALAQAK